jgi:hypothetical protein
MLIATEGLVGGDGAMSVPLADVIPERYSEPEWHSLRLFGRGRHPGEFAAGVETRDTL